MEEHDHDPDAPMFGLSLEDQARDEDALRRDFDAQDAARRAGPEGGDQPSGSGGPRRPPRRPRKSGSER
jgi:hypothetical protein